MKRRLVATMLAVGVAVGAGGPAMAKRDGGDGDKKCRDYDYEAYGDKDRDNKCHDGDGYNCFYRETVFGVYDLRIGCVSDDR